MQSTARKLEATNFDLLRDSEAFSTFSVKNLESTKKFYGETLGLDISEEKDMGLNLSLAGDNEIFIYAKYNHTPATFTILNFPVSSVEEAVDQLKGRGVKFEQYGGDIKTNERGIFEGDGHKMAWFKDPAGNILSVIEEK